MRNYIFIILIYFLIIVSLNAQVLPLNRYKNPNIASLIWDNTASNGIINNGNGTWNTSNTWVTTSSGSNMAWVAGSSATFGGNPGIGAAGTVTVSGIQTVKSLIFEPTPSGIFLLTGGTLSLQGGLITTNQSATINSTLTGGGSFAKRGIQTLTLGGNNTFTGNIIISQGKLQFTTSTAGGLTTIELGDSQTGSNNIAWQWSGGFQPSNNIKVNNEGTGTVTIGAFSAGSNTSHSGNINLNRSVLFFDFSNDRTTFTGLISGNAGIITIDGNGTWNASTGSIARVTFENSNNSFTGQIIINTNKALQMGKGISNSTVNVINSQPVENNGSLVLHAGNNSTALIGALSGASTGICEIHSGVTGPQTLSFGNNNGSSTYNGVFRNGLGGQVLNIRKEGTGKQILTGASTHSGTTVINNGVLGGTGTLSNTSTTTINSNGIIMGGTGSGNAGVFNVRNLIFATGSTAAIDVYSNLTTLSRVQVTGTCNLGTTSKINLMQAMPAGTFNIIMSSGTMSGTNPTLGTNLSGRAVIISKSGNNLIVTLT